MNKENFTKFYSTYKLYIFPAVVALSSLFLIIFVIYPQAAKLITNQKREEDIVNKSKFLENKVSALEGYNGEDLSRKLDYTLSAYPQDKDFGNVIGLLQQLAGQSGFTVTSITLGSASAKGGADLGYGIKLEVTGAKALIQILLSNLENSPRLLRINNIEISSGNRQTADVSLAISVLYSPFPQNFGSVDSPLPSLVKKDQELLTKLTRVNTIPSQFSANLPASPRGKSNPFE